jgi:hypothetical protein
MGSIGNSETPVFPEDCEESSLNAAEAYDRADSFFQKVQKGLGAHLTSYLVGTDVLKRVQS